MSVRLFVAGLKQEFGRSSVLVEVNHSGRVVIITLWRFFVIPREATIRSVASTTAVMPRIGVRPDGAQQDAAQNHNLNRQRPHSGSSRFAETAAAIGTVSTASASTAALKAVDQLPLAREFHQPR